MHDAASDALNAKDSSKPCAAVSKLNVSMELACWPASNVDPRKLPVILGCTACTANAAEVPTTLGSPMEVALMLTALEAAAHVTWKLVWLVPEGTVTDVTSTPST